MSIIKFLNTQQKYIYFFFVAEGEVVSDKVNLQE